MKNESRAGSSADTGTRRADHFVFGSHGIGAGVAETWTALPVLGVRLRGGKLFGLRAVRPPAGSNSPLEAAFLPGNGSTKAALVGRLGKSRSTVDRHLRRLAIEHLAVADGRGTWWAFSFDADALADELGFVDPEPALRASHRRDRINFYARVAAPEETGGARLLIVDDDDLRCIVDGSTGVVLERADTSGTQDALTRWWPQQEHDAGAWT